MCWTQSKTGVVQKHFNSEIGFDNVKLYNQAHGIVTNSTSARVATNNTTIKVATASTGFMKVNHCQVGQSSCLSEVVPVRLSDGSIFRIKLHYDSGAQHCLRNEFINPIVLSRWQSSYPIELATVNASSKSNRTIAKVKLNDFIFDSIIVKGLTIETVGMSLPLQWAEYKAQWSEQSQGGDGIGVQSSLDQTK